MPRRVCDACFRKLTETDAGSLFTLNLKALERAAIDEALCRTWGSQKKAAKLLGVNPRVLAYKMKQLRIRRPQAAPDGALDGPRQQAATKILRSLGR